MELSKQFNPIQAKYKNIEDLRVHFTFVSCFPPPVLEDIRKKLEEYNKIFIENVEKVYQDGDELWHFNDFDISKLREFFPMRGCKECIMLKRNGETIREFTIRRS